VLVPVGWTVEVDGATADRPEAPPCRTSFGCCGSYMYLLLLLLFVLYTVWPSRAQSYLEDWSD